MPYDEEGRRLRTFYVLIFTQTLSLIGSRISGLAISIWIFGESGDVTPLALVSFFYVVPQVLAAGFGGAFADRHDRKLVMIASDTGLAIGTVLLLISFLSGAFELWHLYLITIIQSIFGGFHGSAFYASITLLIPDSRRDRANALQQLSAPLAGAVAVAIAGMTYAAIGVVGSIIVDLATFFLAFVTLLFLNIPRPEQSAEGRLMQGKIWQEAFAGLGYLWARPALMLFCLWIALLNFLLGTSGVLQTPYILARTGSEAEMGIVLAVANLGALAGGLIMAAWGGRRPRINIMMSSIAFAGIFLALTGVSRSAIPIAVALFIYVFMFPFASASSMSILQIKVPPDVQGRVFAAVSQMAMAMLPLAYLVAGPLADHVFEPAIREPYWEIFAPLVGESAGAGIGLLFVISGVLTAAVSVAAYSAPMIRNIKATCPTISRLQRSESQRLIHQ